MGVLALEWFAQSQDLCWRDTSSSDYSEEPQEPQQSQFVDENDLNLSHVYYQIK